MFWLFLGGLGCVPAVEDGFGYHFGGEFDVFVVAFYECVGLCFVVLAVCCGVDDFGVDEGLFGGE